MIIYEKIITGYFFFKYVFKSTKSKLLKPLLKLLKISSSKQTLWTNKFSMYLKFTQKLQIFITTLVSPGNKLKDKHCKQPPKSCAEHHHLCIHQKIFLFFVYCIAFALNE